MHGYKLPGILALFVFFTAFAVQISGSAAELAHGMDVQECPMESLGHVRELLEGRFDELPVSQLMLTLKGAMSKSDRPKLLFQTDYEVLQRVVNLGVQAASAATSGLEGSEAGTLKVDDISVLRPAQLWVLVEEHADPDWIDVPGMTELVSIRDNFVSYFGAILCRGLFPHLVEENSDAAGASEGKSSCALVEPLRADGSCQLHDITSQLVVIDAQHLASHAGMFSDSTEDAGQLVIARIVEDLAIHGVAVVDGLFGARLARLQQAELVRCLSPLLETGEQHDFSLVPLRAIARDGCDLIHAHKQRLEALRYALRRAFHVGVLEVTPSAGSAPVIPDLEISDIAVESISGKGSCIRQDASGRTKGARFVLHWFLGGSGQLKERLKSKDQIYEVAAVPDRLLIRMGSSVDREVFWSRGTAKAAHSISAQIRVIGQP